MPKLLFLHPLLAPLPPKKHVFLNLPVFLLEMYPSKKTLKELNDNMNLFRHCSDR
jgi:hypothetical protein